ncbi:MAG: 16S rRNA (guanine(527)-N(7))-methyltransferase RsmG [Marinibacterium sp.]
MTGLAGPGPAALGVSRETYDRLAEFAGLLEKWTRKINLISRRDQSVIWDRHIRDSIQVFRAAPETPTWVDLGSGGGLPGAIVAILAAEAAPATHVTLIESDLRKATFLRNVARECNLDMTVLHQRIESASPQGASVVSARALADLTTLLDLAQRHAAPNCTMIFPKGKSWGKEVKNAQARWNFSYHTRTSETEPEAVLLIIEGVSRD